MASKPKPWSKEELEILFDGKTRLPLKTYAVLGAMLNRDPEAVRSKWNKTDWVAQGFSLDNEHERFAAKAEFYDKKVILTDKRFARADLSTELIVDAIERSINVLPKVNPPVYKPSKNNKQTNSPEDVGLLLSDLHVGHQHTLEDTNGISEYNHDVFLRRMENLKVAMVEIVELHRKMYKLPKLHIFCVGDIVAGMNDAGNWSPLYIATPIIDQAIQGFEAMSSMINYWLGLFDEINFYGIVGNHGRSAKQGIQKDHDNWDYVAYKFLELKFQNNPRIKFHIPKSWWSCETVRNHNFLLVHGDYVRAGGLPLKGLLNFEQKMGSILKKYPDYTLAGHYHNSSELTTNSGRLIINGSFIGSDVYSLRNIHAASKPEQKLFGINDTHGITWSYNINLDIDRKLT